MSNNQTSNLNNQIITNNQFTNNQTFGYSDIGYWKLFGDWNLVIGISIIVFCFLLTGCQNKPLYKETRIMMGTYIEVISPDKKAANIAFSEIKRIENLLSKYDPDSEVSKLNKRGKLTISPETFYVLQKSKEFWALSNGAFDITVGPLMDLWGFTDKRYKVPRQDEIEKRLSLVGMEKIIFNNENNMVEFNFPGMKIDLGAIGKGFAVDCAVKKLKEAGITSCLVKAGGAIYCLGDKPRSFLLGNLFFWQKGRGKFGRPWKIAIQNPRGKGVIGYVKLKDQAIDTSGDYEQYFIKNNKRYAHIFNPKTGYPAESKVSSVTVIAPDSLTADALATTIFVLGKEKGEKLVEKIPHTKAIIEEK